MTEPAAHVLFGSRVYVYRNVGSPELRDELREYLLRIATPNDVRKSNAGGWHSGPLEQVDEACLRTLRTLLGELFVAVLNLQISRKWQASWNMSCWAVINRNGDYNVPHCHPTSHWSNVYYVDAGDPSEERLSGCIEFVDPRGSSATMMAAGETRPFFEELYHKDAVRHQPETGMLIFFPSYLVHMVHPYRGERPRIAISSNYRITEGTLE